MSYKYTSYQMVLTVYNERARIKRTVDYYSQFAKLVVVDNYSNDGTLDILKDLGVKYIQYRNNGSIQTKECTAYLFSLIDTDYVLLLSCSEFFSPQLMALFDAVAREGKYGLVSMARRSYTCGEFIPLWGGRFGVEARIQRFFNRSQIDLEKIFIHKDFVLKSGAKDLVLPFEKGLVAAHLREADAMSLLSKSTAYASVEAMQRDRLNKPLTAFGFLMQVIKETLRFIQLPPPLWGRIALREIWARLVMHSATYFIGWELRASKGIAYSQNNNADLWADFVTGKRSVI